MTACLMMAKKTYTTFPQLVNACVKLPFIKHIAPVPEASRQLLESFYTQLYGPARNSVQNLFDSTIATQPNPTILKPPIILSFHPKISLLNNNVHECLLASLLAKQLNLMPIWIPFMYDTATHSAAEGGKIRAPTFGFIENEFIQLRSITQIRGNIVKTEKPVTEKELEHFFQSLEDHVLNRLEMLQNHFDQYNFGHYLFPLKQAVFHCDRQEIINKLTSLKEILLNRINNALNLGEIFRFDFPSTIGTFRD